MLRKALPITLLLIVLTSLTFPVSLAQNAVFYNENITVYLIGNTALTRFNFTGTQVGFNGSSDLETSFSDISYYRLYVGKFKSWPSEYFYFSDLGYDILLSKYASSNCAFLYIRASSLSSAQQFASRLGNFTGFSFSPYGTLDNMFVFFSPSVFDEVFKEFLSTIYPRSFGGFSLLLSPSNLLSETSLQFTLIGTKVSGSFQRSVIVDLFKSQAFTSNSLNLGKTLFIRTKVNSSNQSDESSFKLVTYGPIILSSDAGNIKRDIQRRKSELSIIIHRKETLSFPNVTVSSSMPSLITYREVSQATLNINEELEVQIKTRNIGTSTATNITYNDDWWSKEGKFSLVTGNSAGKIDSLAPGENRTIVYRLKLTSSNIEDYYIPQLDVKYNWKIAEETIQLSSSTNDIYLILNQNKPSVYLTAQASSSTTIFGTPNQVIIKVSNRGKYSAFNLNFAGQIISILPAGENWQTTIQVPIEDLSSPKSEKNWICSWSNGTQTKTSKSNNLILTNAYDKMKIPLIDLTKNVNKIMKGEKTFLNVTVSIQNVGEADAHGVTIKDNTIPGLRYINGTFSEREGLLTALVENIKISEIKTFVYLLEVLDQNRNYILPPASAQYNFQETSFTRTSTADGSPVGLTIILHLEDKDAFDKYNTTGYYIIKNNGDQDIYRLLAILQTDPKLNITSSNYIARKAILKAGSEERINFNLRFNGVGANNKIYAFANFYFAGQSMNVSSPIILATSYPQPKITLSLKDEAIEGQPFKIDVVIKNLANVTLNNIKFKIAIPSQLKIIEGTDTIQIQSLEAERQEVISLKLSTDFPREYKIETSKISFSYKGESITTASTSLSMSVLDNLMIRYLIPLAILLVLMIVSTIVIGRIKK